MRFVQTEIQGLIIVELEPRSDSRGSFTEAYIAGAFEAHGLRPDFQRCHFATNVKAGTVRGMHCQADPHAQAKVIYCLRGRVYDVAIDLRPGSATYRKHLSVELSEDGHRAFYIPEGFAHGVQAITDGSSIMYMVSGGDYKPTHERGVRPDDPAIGIRWPLPMVNVSPRDLAWPLLE